MKPPNNLKNKTPSDTYWRVQLVCKKIKDHSSLEPPVEYNQDQVSLTNQINHLGSYRNIIQFQISSGKENR